MKRCFTALLLLLTAAGAHALDPAVQKAPRQTAVIPAQSTPDVLQKLNQELIDLFQTSRQYSVSIQGWALPSSRTSLVLTRPMPLVGSGFLIPGGYVVTAAEVVEGIPNPYIVLFDGRHIKADAINYSTSANIAVLHVPFVSPDSGLIWSRQRSLQTGSLALAMGVAGGFPASPSLGMIASQERNASSLDNRYHYRHLIQFQGTVAAGSSGSPLLNINGHVIGMIIGASSWMSHGPSMPFPPPPHHHDFHNDFFPMPFNSTVLALPASTLQPKVEALIKGVRKLPAGGWIGIFLSRKSRRPMVKTVFLDAAAGKAGMRPGDIILSINQQPTPFWYDFIHAASQTIAGQTLHLEVMRGKKTLQLTLQITAFPSSKKAFLSMKRISLPDTPH